MAGHDKLRELLQNITSDIYLSLKRAVELGRWQNGERLTESQRELCLQAVIYYDAHQKPEHERVGFIAKNEHTHCGSNGDEQHDHSKNKWDGVQLLVFKNMQHSTLKH